MKAANYLLLNEKAALELKLSGKESQEKAYLVTIEHLKSEVSDQQPGQGGEELPATKVLFFFSFSFFLDNRLNDFKVKGQGHNTCLEK